MTESGSNLPPDEQQPPPPGGGWAPPPPAEHAPTWPQGPPFGPPPQQGPPPGYPSGPPTYEQGPPPGYPQGPPPGYQQGPQPGYQQGPPPGYPQGPQPGYQQGPPTGYGQGTPYGRPQIPEAPPRPAQPNLLETAPTVVASLAISLGVILLWFAALFVAIGEKEFPGKQRWLQFLSPGSLNVALAMVVAVVLVAIHRERTARPQAQSALLIAIVLAGAVGFAGLVRGVIELTIARQHGLTKLGHFVDGLAAIPVAAAAIICGLRVRSQDELVATTPVAAAAGPSTASFSSPSPSAADPSGSWRPPPSVP